MPTELTQFYRMAERHRSFDMPKQPTSEKP